MREIFRGRLAAPALLLLLTIAGTADAADRPARVQDDPWILKQIGLELADVTPLGTAELRRTRGAGFLSALLGALLAGLPNENTVQVTIDDQPTQTSSGPGPQTLSGTVNGTTFSTSASNAPSALPPPPTSVLFTSTSVRTRTRTHSFSFSIGL